MRPLLGVLGAAFFACGGFTPVVPVPPSDAGATRDAGAGDAGEESDAGELDAGETDAGDVDGGFVDVDAGVVSDAGVPTGWRFVPVAGSKCARGAQAGIGYNVGSSTELIIYLQGGGACWNTGTCQPSVQQWGPICNYGSNNVCLWNAAGGTQPLAALVSHPDPYPADGGGAFPSELASVASSLLFARRPENPLRDATMVFVPYCTGDLHAGDAVRTYQVKADLFAQPTPRQHHFAGAANLDAYFAWLRTQHPTVQRIWFIGVSGGGYGVSLNLGRVKRAFPEAEVHLLADSAPMIPSAHWNAWASAWNLQLPQGCTDCDAGLPETMDFTIDTEGDSRIALLAYDPDNVITPFFYAGGTTAAWASPPYGTYTANLAPLLDSYDTKPNARYFALPEQKHVMIQGYGMVQADGGISAPYTSRDGGTTLRAWVDAWITGTNWTSQR